MTLTFLPNGSFEVSIAAMTNCCVDSIHYTSKVKMETPDDGIRTRILFNYENVRFVK